ncbi:MAG: PadR family transcriptional regulator [Pseudomonadota bacterium]
MNVKTLCLAILYFQDATGYEIRKLSTEGRYSHFVDASFGSIYPALNRLEQENLVTCRSEVEPGKPSRKIYSITDAGRDAFMEALAEPPSKDVYRSEFLLVAMCAEFLPEEIVKNAIETRVGHLQAEIELLKGFAEDERGTAGIRWAAAYGMECMTNSLRYLSENREHLEKLAGRGDQSEQAPPAAAE